MFFNSPDYFARYLQFKSGKSWSSLEILRIFKHRYGKDYDVALANMLMDSLRRKPERIRATEEDKKYEKVWDKVLTEWKE